MKVKNSTLRSASLWTTQLKELSQRYTVFYEKLPHSFQHQRDTRDTPSPSTEDSDSEDASTLPPTVSAPHREVADPEQGSGQEVVTVSNTEQGKKSQSRDC